MKQLKLGDQVKIKGERGTYIIVNGLQDDEYYSARRLYKKQPEYNPYGEAFHEDEITLIYRPEYK